MQITCCWSNLSSSLVVRAMKNEVEKNPKQFLSVHIQLGCNSFKYSAYTLLEA